MDRSVEFPFVCMLLIDQQDEEIVRVWDLALSHHGGN